MILKFSAGFVYKPLPFLRLRNMVYKEVIQRMINYAAKQRFDRVLGKVIHSNFKIYLLLMKLIVPLYLGESHFSW